VTPNTCPDRALGVTSEQFEGKHEADWEKGHFWENGYKALLSVSALPALLFDPDRYGRGMVNFFWMLHRAGVTTALDMGIGTMADPTVETELIRKTAESTRAPARVVLTPLITDFLARGLTQAQAPEASEDWAKATATACSSTSTSRS
jgi:hypothetical protein